MKGKPPLTRLNQAYSPEWTWLLRNRKGIYSWLLDADYLNLNLIDRYHKFDFFLDDSPIAKDNAIRGLLQTPYLENGALDILLKALIRAETRLVSRFIPQQSNEERLTGHFVSEIGGAIDLARPEFKHHTVARYSQAYPLDFLYFDASKGGKLENSSGADFGLIVNIDLPDMPRRIKGFLFQAKRINGSTQIKLDQFTKLVETGKAAANYIFYDMNLKSALSPLAITCKNLEPFTQALQEPEQRTTSIKQENIFPFARPFSLFLIENLYNDECGIAFETLGEASLEMQPYLRNQSQYGNFLTVLSLGQAIGHEFDAEGQVTIR